MANGNTTIIVDSDWQEHSAAFSACQVLFHTIITNQLPETGCIMPWLRLFAFAGRMVV